MTRWYSLRPADASLFDSAPHLFRYEKHYAATPEQVWESLQSDESVAAWGNTVGTLRWTSPRPFGVPTTREVCVGPMKVHERFFRWDEGAGYAFYVYEATAPLFRRFAEDYRLAAEGGGTRFTWTVAIEPAPLLRWPFKALAPMVRAGFGRMAADGQKYFAAR